MNPTSGLRAAQLPQVIAGVKLYFHLKRRIAK